MKERLTDKQDIEITNYVRRQSYGLHDHNIVIKFPGRKNKLFKKRPDHMWDQFTFLFKYYRENFHGDKAAGA
jgi:hypothetical protein